MSKFLMALLAITLTCGVCHHSTFAANDPWSGADTVYTDPLG